MLRLAALGVALTLLTLSSIGHAAPSPQQLKEAKSHFAQGKAFQDAGAWDDAIKEYDAAFKLAPLPQLLFNIGQCYRLKGDKPKALEAYQRFIDAAPEGSGADDARDHIASLKLRIQVEESEAARRKSAEEAETARKQAAEAEAARKRLEAEDAALRKGSVDEEARMRRVADELTDRQRRQRAADDAARAKRLADAQQAGRTLRIVGGAGAGAGVLIVALSFIILSTAENLNNQLDVPKSGTAVTPGTMWTAHDQQIVDQGKSDSQALIAMWAVGGAVAVVGSAVAIAGAVVRSRAIDRVQLSVAPVIAPTGGGIAVGGRF